MAFGVISALRKANLKNNCQKYVTLKNTLFFVKENQ